MLFNMWISHPSQFLSNIFVVPKQDGSHRLILNLRELNESVEKHHFKMETLRTAITLIRPNMFFCSMDLKQAYYSVAVSEVFRKFLRFTWNGIIYEYTRLTNGLLSMRPRHMSSVNC